MRVIVVPAGIGDVSWMWSKIKHVEEPFSLEIVDGWPYRTLDYVELLPGMKDRVTYSKDVKRYDEIIQFEQALKYNYIGDTWKHISETVPPEGRLFLEANLHLERGHPLEDWLPDLPCDFHYPIETKPLHKAKAADWLEGLPKPVTAISCASYRGAQAWKTWDYEEWSPFLKWWLAQVGGSILLVGGSWDDLTDSLAVDGHRSCVGKTHIGTCIEILKHVEYYIGFSSGLNVIRTVLDKNAFALWPEHQVALSTSWVPPKHLIEGKYGSCMWQHPDIVKRHIELWLKRQG